MFALGLQVYTNNVTQCSVESSRKPGMVIRKTMFDFSTLERWLEEARNGLHAFAQLRNEPGNYERRGRMARPGRSVALLCSPNRQHEDERGDEVCVFANAAGTGLYKAISAVRPPRGSSQMKLTFYARAFACGSSSSVVTVFRVFAVDPSKNDQVVSSFRDDHGQIVDERYVSPVLARVFQVRARKMIECAIHKWNLRYTCPS
jgi:hypothetical protein